jgi:serine/threonine protein kinase
LAEQIGGALDAAHVKQLLHRDVKPANILMRDLSANLHAYLTDFGVARPFVELRESSRDGLTDPGNLVGTPGFLAPEQIENREVDGRADLYALGCVLFEALSGKPPFRCSTNFALLVAHTTAPRPLVSEFTPRLGTAFDGVLDRAIAIEPNDRFPSGRALAEALAAATRAPARFPLVDLGPRSPGAPASSPSRLVVALDDEPRTSPPAQRPAPAEHLTRASETTGTGRPPGPIWPPPPTTGVPRPHDPARRGRTNAMILLFAALLVLGAVIAILVQGGSGRLDGPSTATAPTTVAASPSGRSTRSAQSKIRSVLNKYADALVRGSSAGIAATFAPEVTRTSEGSSYPCVAQGVLARGKPNVRKFYELTAFENLTTFTLPGLRSSRVQLPGGRKAVVSTSAQINQDDFRTPFTFRLRQVGKDWKITEIRGPNNSC